MRIDTLDILQCPDCAGHLSIERMDLVHREQVLEGLLACGDCAARFPIREGIARMLPKPLRAVTEGPAPPPLDEATTRKCSEMRARDAQVRDYDRMWHLALFGLAEIPVTLLYLSLEPQHVLLEAGCGTGRMTPHFASRCRCLVGVDFSLNSLKACSAKLRAAGISNVDLVQADLCSLPFVSEAFHRVASCQVLEHVPTHQARLGAVGEMSRVLRTGGVAAISAYRYAFPTNLFTAKEGEHAGGIPYTRFTRQEMLSLLSASFAVHSITGALLYHYTARCVKVPSIGSTH